MTKVSIIIPLHNGEQYIKKCIDSVLNQTYKNIEVLLVDDGSTDKGALVCDTYVRSYDNIHLYRTPRLGPSNARNVGIQNCIGNLIYFLDIDDSIEPWTIEVLVKEYERHDVDWVIGDFYRVTDGIKRASGNELTHPEDTLLDEDDILCYIRKYFKIPYKYILFNHCWNRLYKVDIIKDNNVLFNPELWNLEDVDFNFKYLNYVRKAFFKNSQTYNYTIRKTSQSFVIGDNLYDVTKYLHTFNSIRKFLRGRSVDELDIIKEVGHLFISYTIIILIRLCGNWNTKNTFKIYHNVAAIINNPEVRKNLKFYSPTKNDIKFLHVLMRYKFNGLTMIACRRRFRTHRKFGKK